jgi:hypothetical protein
MPQQIVEYDPQWPKEFEFEAQRGRSQPASSISVPPRYRGYLQNQSSISRSSYKMRLHRSNADPFFWSTATLRRSLPSVSSINLPSGHTVITRTYEKTAASKRADCVCFAIGSGRTRKIAMLMARSSSNCPNPLTCSARKSACVTPTLRTHSYARLRDALALVANRRQRRRSEER